MAKYKVGDRVRIVSEKPDHIGFDYRMEPFVGKTVTVRSIQQRCSRTVYLFNEAYSICNGYLYHWWFYEDWISGLAEPEKPADENLSVAIQFHGRLTVAELCKNGRVVKFKTARCSPKDEYSRSEGARIAVERLFEKKSTGKAKEASKPKIGDKFVVTGNTYFPHHYFNIGEIVTLTYQCKNGISWYRNKRGIEQVASNLDVKPYKVESK